MGYNVHEIKVDGNGNRVSSRDYWVNDGSLITMAGTKKTSIVDLNGNQIGEVNEPNAGDESKAVKDFISTYQATQKISTEKASTDSQKSIADQAIKDAEESKRIASESSLGAVNDLATLLNKLKSGNQSTYSKTQNALRLGEGQTAAKTFGGSYDVDLNNDGVIQANEKGAGNVGDRESIFGQAQGATMRGLAKSGITDYNTIGANTNARINKDLSGALMGLTNENAGKLTALEQAQRDAELAAERDLTANKVTAETKSGKKLVWNPEKNVYEYQNIGA